MLALAVLAIQPAAWGAIAAVAVAVLGLMAAPIAWFMARFDRRNTQQHNDNGLTLLGIAASIQTLDEKFDRHLEAHASAAIHASLPAAGWKEVQTPHLILKDSHA